MNLDSEPKRGHLQVLDVTTGHHGVGGDLDLSLTLLADLHDIAQVTDAPFDFDPVVKKLLKSRDIEDLVGSRLRGIDDELRR